MSVRKLLVFLGLAILATPVSAQLVTATLPTTCNAAQTACIRATPVVNPDGTSIAGGSGPAASQLPATLGAKTGALSLSVVPNTDTAFPVSGLVGVKGNDGATIAGPSNGFSVLGTKLNDGTQSSTGGTHLTMGGVDTGTNVYRPLLVDSSGRGIAVGAGTAGTPAGGIVTVQGVASMTALKVDGSGVTQPVSAASLPLPTGAATSALQTTINTTLGSPFQTGGSIGNTSFAATQATASSLNATVTAPLANLSTSATNPFPGAGRYNTTFPTLTNGQLSELQLAVRGGLRVQLVLPDTAGNIDYLNGTADARPTSINGLAVASYGFGFDGTAFSRLRTITGSDGTGIGMTGVSIAPQSIAPGAITPCISASAAETSKICKASAGNYYDGYCQSSAAGRCILYNSTTVPGAGALTAALVLECVTVPAGGSGSWAYGDIPRRASTGMVILFSTGGDCNTYTASSTAYIHGSVM